MMVLYSSLERLHQYKTHKFNKAVLKFQYTVVDYNGFKEEHLNIDFKNLLGDILCDIVDKHYSEGLLVVQNQTIEVTTLSQLLNNEEFNRKVTPFLKKNISKIEVNRLSLKK